MSRVIIDVGEERKKKMNLLVKGKNAKFKSYNELIRRALDEYFESIQINDSSFQKLNSITAQIPPSKGKIIIKLEESGASAYLDEKLIIEKKETKDLIFFLWENYPGYQLEFTGIKPQDYIFATFSEIKCWDMPSIDDQSFPVVPIEIQNKNNKLKIIAQVDTASSTILLDNSLKKTLKAENIGQKKIITPLGENEFDFYLVKYNYNDITIECETIFVDLPEFFKELNIQALIGENLLRNKNLLVLYLRKVICVSN